ncbi:MAG: hypothetical protein A4E73_01922 [Syntrophaceae bacterium PtaU1.Bin231]|nr:MAG: hypothetical protein A4E73_01922 [Syntrophaceae bacterium PtaU1.Bin231]
MYALRFRFGDGEADDKACRVEDLDQWRPGRNVVPLEHEDPGDEAAPRGDDHVVAAGLLDPGQLRLDVFEPGPGDFQLVPRDGPVFDQLCHPFQLGLLPGKIRLCRRQLSIDGLVAPDADEQLALLHPVPLPDTAAAVDDRPFGGRGQPCDFGGLHRAVQLRRPADGAGGRRGDRYGRRTLGGRHVRRRREWRKSPQDGPDDARGQDSGNHEDGFPAYCHRAPPVASFSLALDI